MRGILSRVVRFVDARLLRTNLLRDFRRLNPQLAETYLQEWRGKKASFDNTTFPDIEIEGFEDYWWLFHVGPSNRGVLRLDFDEARLLFLYCRRIQQGNVLEIGRYNGGSTFLLASSIGAEARLISIDISPRDDIALTKVLEKYHVCHKVRLITADANEVQCDKSFRLIFIDGDHSYEGVRNDFDKWSTQLGEGAYLVFHDVLRTRANATCIEGCSQFIQEVLENRQDEYQLVDSAGSLAVFQVKE